MSSFRSWWDLFRYRFLVSSEELQMSREDRKVMNSIRRTLNDVEHRMRLYERQGGNCSENGGRGVSLNLWGFRLIAFRSARQEEENLGDSEGTVVPMEKYRNKS